MAITTAIMAQLGNKEAGLVRIDCCNRCSNAWCKDEIPLNSDDKSERILYSSRYPLGIVVVGSIASCPNLVK